MGSKLQNFNCLCFLQGVWNIYSILLGFSRFVLRNIGHFTKNHENKIQSLWICKMFFNIIISEVHVYFRTPSTMLLFSLGFLQNCVIHDHGIQVKLESCSTLKGSTQKGSILKGSTLKGSTLKVLI